MSKIPRIHKIGQYKHYMAIKGQYRAKLGNDTDVGILLLPILFGFLSHLEPYSSLLY